jgi:5-deoxy-5-amino-3-dehydroquinate synthase
VIVIPVALADRPYDVVVGHGARHELAAVVSGLAGVQHAAVVTQPAIAAAGWLEGLDCGVPFDVHLLGEGEGAKSLASLESLCGQFARSGLSRADVVVALGGGIVTDVAGFAAASYHRGVRYVNVATSLLGQVDAAIGGKTGVNIAEGKNLLGAFWQPAAVLCDTETLATLPPREWRCGRGEMAKYAFLGEGTPAASLLELDIEEQVAACVAIKAAVVAADETEQGGRLVLNYGHTLAHALEAQAFGAEGPELAHGEAVAIGLVFAALLARRLGRIDDARVELHRRVVAGFDLAAELPEGSDPERLVAFMGRDKKARHDLTFVLDGPRGVEPVGGVGEGDVVATLAEMGTPR